MQRYAKIPESVINSGELELIGLWAVLYLDEIARQAHSHDDNMIRFGINRSRYYRILRRVREFIEGEQGTRSKSETRVRLKRDSSETRARLKRDSSETPKVQTIPTKSESKISKRDSSETRVTLTRDSSETRVTPEQDSTPVQVRKPGTHVGLYKNKNKNQDHDIFYEEPLLKSDRELFEMDTVERLRYIALNEDRLRAEGRI